MQPTQSPTAGNNYISSTSPLIQKLNNIESNVTAIQIGASTKISGCFWTGEASCGTGFTQIRTAAIYYCNTGILLPGATYCGGNSVSNIDTAKLCCSQ